MYQIGLTCTVSLDVFLSWAMFVLDENHFRKCFFGNEAVWLVRKVLFSGNWNPLTEKKSLWPWKSFYTSIFLSKYFRKMRERERARAITISSPHRSRSRRQTFQSPLIAISPSRDRAIDRDLATWSRSRSHRIKITVDRDLAKIAISPSWDRAVDRDLAKKARSRSRRRSRSQITIDGAIWVVACVFLDLCFPSSFPNTRKYFPENFLKCNQTPWKHFPFSEISIFGKYVFFEKRFTATKHSLDLSVCSWCLWLFYYPFNFLFCDFFF